MNRETIAQLKAEGRSIKSIAEEYGIARATVRTILSRVAESGPANVEISN